MTTVAKKTLVKTNSTKALNAQKTILSALQFRIDNVVLTAKGKSESEKNASALNQAKNLKAELSFYTLPVIEHALSLDIDFDLLAKNYRNTDDKARSYVAVYAMQKIRKMLTALAQGLASSADGYSHTILFNLLHGKQNNKTLYVSLSRSIEFTELETQEIIKKRYTCNASTAKTQASSTRMMMMFLNIASVSKNKVNDVFTLNDNKVTERARAIFIKELERKE